MTEISTETLRTPDAGASIILEVPALTTLTDAALCLHFAQDRLDYGAVVEGQGEVAADGNRRPLCSVICSMELDLLSFKYQESPPLQTNLTYDDPERVHCLVDVILPAGITYTSESVMRTLVRANAAGHGEHRIRCEGRLAQSYFPESRCVVWHLVLSARRTKTSDRSADVTCARAFDEYDLIKLMHLYENDTEQVALADRVRFDVRRTAADEAVRCARDELLFVIWDCLAGDEFRRPPFFAPPISARPRSGTVQLVTGPSVGGTPVERVFDHLHLARREAASPASSVEGASASETLSKWIAESGPSTPGAALKAIAGITNSIFDFREVDVEELLDTLDPTFRSGRSFIKFHRRSLVVIRDADRVLDSIREDLGISPYAIIPHAVVLHNEELVDGLEACLDTYAESGDIKRLERLSVLARRVVRRMILPNVFNYVTERTLYDRAFEIRGSSEKYRNVVRRTEELDRVLDKAYEHRRRRHDIFVQALLLLLALAQAASIFVGRMPDFGFERAMIVAVLLALAGLYFVFRSRW